MPLLPVTRFALLRLGGCGLYLFGAVGMAAWIERTESARLTRLPIVRTWLSIWLWFLVAPYHLLFRRLHG